MSSKTLNYPVKHIALSTLVLGMGIEPASAALDLKIVNMLFDNSFRATGNIVFDPTQPDGQYTSIDPFFGSNWTADVQAVFTTPGAHTWADTTSTPNSADDDTPIENFDYQFTLDPGQLAAGVFFNWNSNNDIPVLTIFDCNNPDSGCVAAGPGDAFGNNVGGYPMQTSPFLGQAPAFNDATGGTTPPPASLPVPGAPPVVLAGNRSISAGVGAPTSWTPNLQGTVADAQCSILTAPAQGTATVQPDCSSGTYTASATGSDSFEYQVTSTSGGEVTAVDTGSVSVSIAGGNVPPTANDVTVTTSVASAVDIDVLANASDPDGSLDPATLTLTQAPSQGVATVDTVNGVITYQPNTGYCGADSLNYTIDDNGGATSNEALATININADALCNASGATIAGGSVNPAGNGEVTLSEIISAGIPPDGEVVTSCVGGCFDYVLTGLGGPTAILILPLSEPLPAAPRFRKWNGAAWVDYVVDAENSIGSAKKVSGLCPGSGYTTGLTKGNDCLRLMISDGGPNDIDGVVNGEIVDPSGPGKNNIPAADPDLGGAFGCTIAGRNSNPGQQSVDWALLAGFVSGLWLWRARRRPSRFRQR